MHVAHDNASSSLRHATRRGEVERLDVAAVAVQSVGHHGIGLDGPYGRWGQCRGDRNDEGVVGLGRSEVQDVAMGVFSRAEF